MVEKIIDAEVKASLQQHIKIREINSGYLKEYKPSIKKNKEYKANWKYQNKNKNKVKSHNLSFANSQSQTQIFKKNKSHYEKDHSAIRVNITKIAKKNKDKNKAKNLSYIKCYTCK